MSEPRRSTRARAREEAAPAPETPKETPAKSSKSSAVKRKRSSVAIKDPTPVAIDSPQGPKQSLPLRITEGQPLPTLPEPQPLELPASEWQDIQQSGVLGASMDRSRAVWISGTNFRVFHKFFNQPKKPADRTDEDKAKHSRQKDLLKNFPELGKDAVVSKDATKDNIEVQAQLVIEPHTFPIRIFAPREIIKQPPKKAPVPSYGSWPNHNQPQHSQPNQYTQYNSQGQPIYQQKPPPPRPPPPKPVQKAPAPTPGPASTPAPDPVIHMLAQRAGVDPELKSVMKIVAAGEASKDQLEFFQSHINELTALLAKQKESAAKANKSQSVSATPKPPSQPPPTPKSVAPSPAPQPVAPSPAPQPIAAPPPPPRPVQPAHPPPPVQHAPKPYNPPPPPQPQLQQMPPVRPSQPPYPNNYGHPPPQYHPPRQPMGYHPHPQPTGYRPLVFSFEEGNKDLLHFPSYSFLEWLPNMSGAKISFLITKMKPKPEQDAVVQPPSTPAPKAIPAPSPGATPSGTPMSATPNPTGFAQTPNQVPGQFQVSTPATPAPYVPQPRIEDFDEKKDVADIEFYQPVTVLLLTDNNEIRNSLVRAIRHPDVVEKYMDEVFDKCKRASETYLAFRLPRDAEAEHTEKRLKSGDGTPLGAATPTVDRRFSGVGSSLGATLVSAADKKKVGGRSRKSIA